MILQLNKTKGELTDNIVMRSADCTSVGAILFHEWTDSQMRLLVENRNEHNYILKNYLFARLSLKVGFNKLMISFYAKMTCEIIIIFAVTIESKPRTGLRTWDLIYMYKYHSLKQINKDSIILPT